MGEDNTLFLVLTSIFGGGTLALIIKEIREWVRGRATDATARRAQEIELEETARRRADDAERAKRILAEALARTRRQFIDAGNDPDDLDPWPTY